MADYESLLARAVENLPNSSPEARATLYQRAKTALISQLRSAKQPMPEANIESELRVLGEAIDRLEARVEGKAQNALVPSTALRGPTKPEPTKQGWLSDLLARASRDDEPAVRTTSKASPDPPSRSPALALLKLSEGIATREKKQAASPIVPVGSPPIEKRSANQNTAPAILSSRIAQEKPMSRIDELNRVLRKLQHDSPGVEASALISEDGLMIASALTSGMEEARVAGMTATLLNLGSRAAVELGRGTVQEVIVRGELGYAVLISAGRGALLLALTNESSKLGLVFFDMREAIRALAKVL
jgi:predicted regulator of Ras-like GTPase activity (Roadblock/LC7/MglB family)